MKQSFKYIATIFIILITGVCLLAGCSNTTEDNTTDEELAIEKPVSDVTDGMGIEGTWEGETVDEEGSSEFLTLALNSDKSYELYIGQGSSEEPTAEIIAAGTYSEEGNSLKLEEEKTNQTDENVEFITLNGDYTYTLENNALSLTSPDGQIYNFTRTGSTDAPAGDETTN